MSIRLSLLLPCILLFVSGCTTTYVKKDFPSETRFYNEINRSPGSTDIIMKNDSVVSAGDIKIEQDSLKWENTCLQSYTFPPRTDRFALPLNNVKAINVTHRWGNNIFTGMFSGMITGAVIGNFLVQMGNSTNSGYHPDDPMASLIPGALAGLLAGSVVGLLVGRDDLFILEEPLSGLKLEEMNSRHKFGIKIARHSGVNLELNQQKGANANYTKLLSDGLSGMMVTLFYNYPFSRLFSLNNELSYVSAGSSTRYSVFFPKNPGEPQSYGRTEMRSSSEEHSKVVELASVCRLNLFRTRISPYVMLGPRLDFLFPDESGIDKYLRNLKNQTNTFGIGLYSEYNKVVLGATLGAGLSTGNLFPVEMLIEARYNYDITPRFKMHYDIPSDLVIDSRNYKDPGNQLMHYRSSEFQLSIGAAIF